MMGTTATGATVLETLHKLDVDFSAMSLGGIITRAIEYLRQRAIDPATQATFEPAFRAALKLSELGAGVAEPHFHDAFTAWPDDIREKIVSVLCNQYSKLLDIRIKHERDDYLLWNAVDIREMRSRTRRHQPTSICAS